MDCACWWNTRGLLGTTQVITAAQAFEDTFGHEVPELEQGAVAEAISQSGGGPGECSAGCLQPNCQRGLAPKAALAPCCCVKLPSRRSTASSRSSLLEARKLIRESVCRRDHSSGFKEFSHAGRRSGGPARQGLSSLHREPLRRDRPRGARALRPPRCGRSLWPRRGAGRPSRLLNAPSSRMSGREDETIGWMYQYFNGEEERREMRDASQRLATAASWRSATSSSRRATWWPFSPTTRWAHLVRDVPGQHTPEERVRISGLPPQRRLPGRASRGQPANDEESSNNGPISCSTPATQRRSRHQGHRHRRRFGALSHVLFRPVPDDLPGSLGNGRSAGSARQPACTLRDDYPDQKASVMRCQR